MYSVFGCLQQFEKLQVEVGILRSLCHKNIVGYLGACMNNRMVYIFMEYISGGSIQNILKRYCHYLVCLN